MKASRRQFLASGVATPLLLAGPSARAAEAEDQLPEPKYQLAMNLELMFPGGTPYEERMEQAARCGAKHYAFWGPAGKNLDAMLEVHYRLGMTCVSIAGSPKTGWTTGLTRPGAEGAFLEDFEAICGVAQRFGAENLVTFVGARQPDVPWEAQRANVVAGLKRAGDIAMGHGVYLTLEPLNRVESPQMSMLLAREAFDFAAEVGHPHVKVDYDLYHRQLGEGNVAAGLEEGLARGLVRFVEVGDVPGRKEPGSGEMNYAFLFRRLRELGYSGAIGMEHGTTKTPQHAWDQVRKLAGLA